MPFLYQSLARWQSRTVLIFSCKNTKITTSCWTTIDRKLLGPTKKKKKNTPHPRTKEKQPQHSWRGTVMFKIKLHTCQRLLEGINKTLWALGPRERSSDPPQERIRSVCECLKSSYGGMGQQWPAAGTGALVTAVLGAIVWGISSLEGGHH